MYYATVEDVMGALDSRTTARDDAQIRRALAAATADVDNCVQRAPGVFRPTWATRYFDWPDLAGQNAAPWRLWLDGNDLISVTTLTVAGQVIPPVDYNLEPQKYGPPYRRIEMSIAGASTWTYAGTPQRAVAVYGLWGDSDNRTTAGTLVGAVNASVTALACSDASLIGVGDQLLIGSSTERVEVTAKTWVAVSGQTLGGAGLTASAAGVTAAVTSGAAFHVGEQLLVDSERMTVVDIAGNNATVRRADDGSVLAAHTAGTAIYARRGLVVTRAAQGSTATTHADGDTISLHTVPADVTTLAVASALATVFGEQEGYRSLTKTASGGTAGGSRPSLNPPGGSIDALRMIVQQNHGRQARTRVV
jgi:hypothetical protein